MENMRQGIETPASLKKKNKLTFREQGFLIAYQD